MNMIIGITNDHGGVKLAQKLTKYLIKKGYTVINYGTTSVERVDYPLYAFALGEAIINHDVECGIAICKTGIGMTIACNKIKGIMCALVHDEKEAKLAKQHNNANVIALSGKTWYGDAKAIVKSFLTTSFSSEDRYHDRFNQIINYENNHIAINKTHKKNKDTNEC